MAEIQISTKAKREVVDITEQVASHVPAGPGTVNAFVAHTTCALSIADMDPGSDQDYLKAFDKIIPNIKFNHPHNPAHMPSHILSTLIGVDVTIPAEAGKLQLGTWQRIVLFEFDGPRERKIIIK